MDLENQKRVLALTEEYGAENIVVLLGASEGEASGLAAETVTAGMRLNILNDGNTAFIVISIMGLIAMLGAVALLVIKKRKYSK